MIHDDTLGNSLQSEPPDIKNWFSSYEYESLVLETNDNFGFSDPQESQSYEKECSTRNTVKPIENSSELVTSEINNGMMNEECHQTGDENYVSDSEDSPLLSPVEESEPPGIDNWFSSYIYESPEVDTIDDIILFDRKESIINQLSEKKEAEKDEKLYVPDNLTRNPTVDSKHDNVGNGFVSIKRKSKRENAENSVNVKRVYASSSVDKTEKCDEKARKRTALGDVTNMERSSVTGKWKCPRQSKPNVGPPLKQLRLGQWFHRV